MKKNQRKTDQNPSLIILMAAVIYFRKREDADFYNFFEFLNQQVTLKGTADWGIGAPKVTELDGKFDIYKPLYDAIKIKNMRTGEQVDAHRIGRDLGEKYIEDFANEFLIENSAITPEVLNTLGFNRPTDERHDRPVITETVFAGMTAQPGSRMEFTCRTTSDASRASILETADAVEIRYIVVAAGAPPPATYLDCPNTIISTKAKFTEGLPPTDAGKKMYAYARWRNNVEVTKSGPFGSRFESMVRE